jgi:hypothetical protein
MFTFKDKYLQLREKRILMYKGNVYYHWNYYWKDLCAFYEYSWFKRIWAYPIMFLVYQGKKIAVRREKRENKKRLAEFLEEEKKRFSDAKDFFLSLPQDERDELIELRKSLDMETKVPIKRSLEEYKKFTGLE